jgi:hypothetical protein
MKKTSDVIACVVDHGLFLPTALKLAETFKQTYYWTPVEKDFPSIKDGILGDGYDRLIRIESPWEVKNRCDLFVFPDIGFSAMQQELVAQGLPVWGGRDADSLEKNRGKFLRTIAEMEMPVPPYERVVGLTNLRLCLRELEDKWIKISRWRGDVETFHWRDWRQDEATLDDYAYNLGPAKELITFYVIDPIDTDIEDGVDTYCIDGRLPKLCFHGMEAKDKAFLGTMSKMDDLPENIQQVTEAFAVVLRDYGYRQFFSTEVRVDGEDSYFIDPTLRAGSPPSQVQTELFGNLADIIWSGANGELVEPEPTATFGAQVRICAKDSRTTWFTVEFDDDIKDAVKCRNCCEIDGRTCFPPDYFGNKDIGWLVATGNTIAETIDTLKELAGELPDGIECDINSLADLLKEVQSAEEQGMEFTDQPVPEPAEVLS